VTILSCPLLACILGIAAALLPLAASAQPATLPVRSVDTAVSPPASIPAPMAQIKAQIHPTEEEWQIIGPKVQRLITAYNAANVVPITSPPGNTPVRPQSLAGPNSFAGPRTRSPVATTRQTEPLALIQPAVAAVPTTQPATEPAALTPVAELPESPLIPPSSLAKAMAELRAATADNATAPELLAQRITAVRRLRAKVKAELLAAQQDLLLMLTPAQEAVLIGMGYLD
jgi:hypothetical protein